MRIHYVDAKRTTMRLCMSSSDRMPDMTVSITMLWGAQTTIPELSLMHQMNFQRQSCARGPNDNEAIGTIAPAASREQRQQVKFSREVHGGSTMRKTGMMLDDITCKSGMACKLCWMLLIQETCLYPNMLYNLQQQKTVSANIAAR